MKQFSILGRLWWLAPVVMWGLLAAALVTWFLLPTPTPQGWTEVGNGTRLLYVDMPDGVRCYRRYYSNDLNCLELHP